MKLAWSIMLVTACVNASVVQAQDDDEDEARPSHGLVASYTSGNTNVRRIDADVAFNWKSAADARLPTGSFGVKWAGRLLVQQPGKYRFYAFVDGRVGMTLAGNQTLNGTGNASWIDGREITLPFGDHPIEVEFSSTPQGTGRVQLFWSGDGFDLEPIPAHLFSRTQPEPELDLAEEATRYFDAYRCGRCHATEHTPPSDPAPSLTLLRYSMPQSAVLEKLRKPPQAGDASKMPHFGFSETEARDVTAFLFSVSRKPALQRTPNSKNPSADQKAGRTLVRTLGCLACHTHDGVGAAGAFAGGICLPFATGGRRTGSIRGWQNPLP